MTFDSTKETQAHISQVLRLLEAVILNLRIRSRDHDLSKLQEPEKSLFDKYTPLLRGTTYGSPEYFRYMEEMGSALAHHYQENDHHPEHYSRPEDPEIEKIDKYIQDMKAEDPARDWLLSYLRERRSRVNGMSLLSVMEMLSDWKAAGMRHEDGSIDQSLEINRKRFEISDQLFEVLKNTVKELGW